MASSYNRMGGFFSIARAMATLCFSPPEKQPISNQHINLVHILPITSLNSLGGGEQPITNALTGHSAITPVIHMNPNTVQNCLTENNKTKPGDTLLNHYIPSGNCYQHIHKPNTFVYHLFTDANCKKRYVLGFGIFPVTSIRTQGLWGYLRV